jgi:MFS family permease
MPTVSSSPSWSSLFHGPRAAHTVLLNLGVAIHAVDVFIITTVLPSVIADIGGAAFYAWSTMLYVVVSIVGTAMGSPVKARLGNRGAYIAGGLVFLAGSIGCAVAPNMGCLLLARAAQGLGGGLLLALSHGMVSALYPADLQSRVFASISGIWGIAALLGPTIGGLFAQIGWWRGAFWISVPVSAVLMGLAWLFLPATSDQTAKRLPWLRLFLLGAGVLCVALSGHVASAPRRLFLIVLACLLVGFTFHLDSRAVERLLPSRPLSLNNRVGTTYWMLFLLGIMTSQFGIFMPLVVQVLHGVSPLGAGYFAALRSIAWTVAALCTAGLGGRAVRLAILLGPLLITVGSVGQVWVVVDGPLLWLAVYVLLTGAGIGVCFAHLNTWAIAGARPGEEHLTAASIPTVRALGFAFGAAFAGVIANAVGFTNDLSPAIVARVATWVYGLCVIPPAVVVLLAVRLLCLQPLYPANAGQD